MTVPDFCSPNIFFEEYPQFTPNYEEIEDCKARLEKSTEDGNVNIIHCNVFRHLFFVPGLRLELS